MILDLLTRLAEQRAAIAEAQVALHRLIELGVGDAAQGALEARTEGGPVAQSGGDKRRHGLACWRPAWRESGGKGVRLLWQGVRP